VPDEDNGVVLSIVIPTLDAAAHLPGCLEALEAGRRTARDLAVVPPDIELVVVDGGSADDTVAIAGRWRCPMATRAC
jgi:glycosyltransferase involved in cell wall biosynthesis